MTAGAGQYLTRPDWVRRINAMAGGAGGAEHLVSLDPDELVATACRTTGLDDFGEPSWEEPYRRLVESLVTEAQLHVVGRLLTRHDLLRHLRTRLLVVDAQQRDPGIADEQIVAPVFVTGPARSGTSILHELLGEDPALRAPLAWEMAHPFPPPVGEPDERAEWAESEFDLWSDVQPEFAGVHELSARLPEECLWLFAPEFEMGFWSTCTQTPSYTAWRAFSDPLPGYRFHRTMLQVLQRGTEATPWALKSPVHLTRLDALFAVYPDARIIHTHRDPVRTIPSTVSTLAIGRWLRSDAVDPRAIAAGMSGGMQFMLNGTLERRAGLPEAQIADLHYLDLLRDPVGAIERAYDHLGMPLAPELPDRIRRYLDARPQDKHGVHRYRAEDFGLDVEQLRVDFAPYVESFGIELEAPA